MFNVIASTGVAIMSAIAIATAANPFTGSPFPKRVDPMLHLKRKPAAARAALCEDGRGPTARRYTSKAVDDELGQIKPHGAAPGTAYTGSFSLTFPIQASATATFVQHFSEKERLPTAIEHLQIERAWILSYC
jgi:hypothetical protein